MRGEPDCKLPSMSPAPPTNLRGRIRSLVNRILELEERPEAIAGGVAIGLAVGFTPLFGLKTVLSLALSLLLRCNPVAAVLAVTLHDVVTPLWPAILWGEYHLGIWMMGRSPSPAVQSGELHWRDLALWGEAAFLDVGLPTLLGSLFFSLPTAAAAYAATLAVLRRRRARSTD